jgi:diguanylate cyclase (GGDEF)-like protein
VAHPHFRAKDLMNNPLRSLAGRIILLVFLATVVSSLTVSWISVQSISSFLHEKVDQRFPQMASRISRELDQWYLLRVRELEVFAGSTILTESVPQLDLRSRSALLARDETEQYLGYVLDSFPQFERLALTNSKGESLIEVGGEKPLPKGLLSASTPSLETNSISDAMRFDDHLIQIASTPMRDAKGRSIGRLYALINLDLISPTLEDRELGETTNVFLVDRNMRILNPPAELDPDIRFVPPRDGSDYSSRSVLGVAHYDNIQNIPVVGTQIAFPRFGWTLVLEQRYDKAFAPVVSSIGRVAGLNLAIVLLVSLVASRIAGSFVKPLRALSDAAKRLSKGEREVEIEETTFTSEEVNVLTRTFNEMSRGLGRSAHELEKSHQTIEAANDELVAKNEELLNVNLVLEQLSITDGLTKLHNHRYFQESISAECKRSLRSAEPLSLILVDIDNFKKWNDRLGHAGGDQILRRLAEILNQSVRETDILTRYGGEEFAILALNTDFDGVVALGEKVRQSVEEENFVTDVPSEKEQLTVSVGVATLHEDRQQLFSDADAALYSAKDLGRNRVVASEPDPE